MPDTSKRKTAPGVTQGGRAGKRSKGGSGGKWQTPHQRAKATATHHRSGGGKIEAGDAGIWATCIKGKEGAATEELKGLFEEVKPHDSIIDREAEATIEQEVEADIESSIQKEISSMGVREGPGRLFTPVYLDLQCVLFFKTIHPVVPVDFVQRICKDASDNNEKRKVKYVNRLTPVTKVARANEKCLRELGKEVLRKHFQLAGTEEDAHEATGGKPASYAIRPTIRNHTTLKRDTVINLIASLIGSAHKVDLTTPERVILVEIYQTTCGIGVVEADWEEMKRYNLAEIYEKNFKTLAKSA